MPQTPVTILSLPQIKERLKTADLIPLIEAGFVAYSNKQAVVPPVGELIFEDPPGETHIKYGYIKEQKYAAVKIASGFYNNPKLGIKASQGVVLLFSQQTGELRCVLLDEGLLTDIRTAIASMITLKYLAPKKVDKIGIIGTGIMAKLQLAYLHQVSDCKEIVVWGRTPKNVLAYQDYFKDSSYRVHIAKDIASLAAQCQVIISTTFSKEALLQKAHIQKGTHITALGSDTAEKIELSPKIIQMADIVVSDSLAQSQSRGEVYQARKANCLNTDRLIELGDLIKNPALGRQADNQITVADLTGVAVQDIMIATAIFDADKI